MYEAKIENKNGAVLTLTGREDRYQVISITGLNPTDAQINTTKTAGMDGAQYNSARLNIKNVVITLRLNGDVERNRLELYEYFRTKEWCRFYYSTESRAVYIDGYVETVECDMFSSGEKMQISILCPRSYFNALTEIITDISNTVKLFQFPFSINVDEPIPFSEYIANRKSVIYNGCGTTIGMIITITTSAAISSIIIRNTMTGDEIGFNYDFHAADIITIDTRPGEKRVALLRNGADVNLFPALITGSKFLQLAAGTNTFGYLVDGGAADEAVEISFAYRYQYRGV